MPKFLIPNWHKDMQESSRQTTVPGLVMKLSEKRNRFPNMSNGNDKGYDLKKACCEVSSNFKIVGLGGWPESNVTSSKVEANFAAHGLVLALVHAYLASASKQICR